MFEKMLLTILAIERSASCPSMAAMKLISANSSMIKVERLQNMSSLSRNCAPTEKSGKIDRKLEMCMCAFECTCAHLEVRKFEFGKIFILSFWRWPGLRIQKGKQI